LFRLVAQLSCAAIVCAFVAVPARAALYWDADATAAGDNTSTGAGLGGTGTWNTSSNWFNGTSEVPWSAGSDAIFTGSAGTVTLDAPQSAASVSFKSDGYIITGSTLTMGPTPANYNVDAGMIATINSTIAGSATMTKIGAGTLILGNTSNTNTATSSEGGWRIEGGTLRITADTALGAALPEAARNSVTDIQLNQSTIQFGADVTMDINRRTKVNTNSTSNLGDGVIDTNGHVVTWYGSIQGGVGSLRVTNSGPTPGLLILGTDHLASINPFGSALPAGSINLTVTGGALVQTSGQVTPTGGELGSETGAGGAILSIKLDGGEIRSESGGYTFQRNLILGADSGTLDTGAWIQTFDGGNISGPGTMGKWGTGNLVLNNPTATWAGGTRVHEGVLQLGVGGSNGLLPGTLANPSTITIDTGATVKFLRGSDKTFYDVFTGGGALTVANANNATVRLVSNSTYTGTTTISSGVLMIGQGNPNQPGSIVSDVVNNATLDFNRVEDISYGGTISGPGTVIKEAAGKLTLTAANTYSGITSVVGGTLIAGNASGSATGTGAVNVASGAGLGGNGTITGTVTINSGGHLSPGTSVGVLTVGSLTLASTSNLDYELGTPASSDKTIISSAGGLTINGGIVSITAATGFGAGEYPLLDYNGTFAGSLANLSIGSVPNGYTYSLINNTANTTIDLRVVVPEPQLPMGAIFIAASLIVRGRQTPRDKAVRGRRGHLLSAHEDLERKRHTRRSFASAVR
jgi:fibronectin-binding autotransporter adhesin